MVERSTKEQYMNELTDVLNHLAGNFDTVIWPMPPICSAKVRLCSAAALSFSTGLAFVALRPANHHASRL